MSFHTYGWCLPDTVWGLVLKLIQIDSTYFSLCFVDLQSQWSVFENFKSRGANPVWYTNVGGNFAFMATHKQIDTTD